MDEEKLFQAIESNDLPAVEKLHHFKNLSATENYKLKENRK